MDVIDGDSDGDLGEEVGDASLAVISPNGMSLNGMSLNGMSLNGMSLNGMSLNGMSLNGMSLNGMSLNGMSLNGTLLGGTKSTGGTISGAGLVGTKMNGTLSSGGTLVLRIDSATTLAAPNTDVWAYGVSYALSGGAWAPLCGSSSVLAVPVSGTFNYGSGVVGGGSWTASATAFTFGCRGTAIAKCVEFGYKPWKTVAGVLLRNHHVACTRMIRADYCGDGKSWTVDGTLINLYDALGIQLDAAAYKVDAEWLPTGARCIDKLRDFQVGKPTCEATKKSLPTCGTFANGALLVDEYKLH
ncbi:MAG TPA: ADYC domain-containing protein [Kofleriaceae bacterium]|nr:ADYC domain-containing protein [Kofleriaceae bacterium]